MRATALWPKTANKHAEGKTAAEERSPQGTNLAVVRLFLANVQVFVDGFVWFSRALVTVHRRNAVQDTWCTCAGGGTTSAVIALLKDECVSPAYDTAVLLFMCAGTR